LNSAQHWPGGHGPFLLAVCAALLTAFYMTRQALLVFFGKPREPGVHHPHESPPVILVPLYVLATGAILLAVVGTPLWPWFEEWLAGEHAVFDAGALFKPQAMMLVGLSLGLVTVGVGASWLVYRHPSGDSRAPDPLEGKLGRGWKFLGAGMYFDAFYEKHIIRNVARMAALVDGMERLFFVPLMALAEGVIKLFGRWTGAVDEQSLNQGFNRVCAELQNRADSASSSQSGRPQGYLRAIGLGAALLLLMYFWITA